VASTMVMIFMMCERCETYTYLKREV